ncbi:MAG: succinyl-diaminopimelate desuccinylase [Kiloniellales bacterium]|nr:succinyl-diaminopimelate desuccinylase [Kiloniellales bacterium]
MAALDSLDLARRLIRCPSVTPEEGGALDLLQEVLEGLGFRCRRLVFSDAGTPDVDNLYARRGEAGPNFCYAGHTDVVPPGDPAAWRHDPFAAALEDGWLYGRGAVDMKGAIAAYLGAVSRFLEARGPDFGGSLSLLITGDEEGPAVNGTRKVLDVLAEDGETLDACLVGEPTSNERLADMVKIGRRGALNARLTVRGVQGHSAYAHLADNPVHRLVAMLGRLTGERLCEGSGHFQPTSLQVTTVDVGNPATNVIPGVAMAGFDVRFSDRHTSQTVERWVRERLEAVGGDYELVVRVSGESFLTAPGPLSELIVEAVADVTGRTPELGTSGGTSDARFIKDFAPVAELGLLNATAHKVDERVTLADLDALGRIYEAVLDGAFAS